MSTQQTGQARSVSEREARQVAEEAREADWQKPSFGKQLYLGDFQLDLVCPHPRPDEEAVRRGEEFCARVREFCETSVDGALIERDARIPDEVVKGLAALGAFGMKIAPQYGGLGLTNMYYNRALIIAGSVSPAIAALLSAHQSIGVPQPLALFGTDDQKQHYLPRCARGGITAFVVEGNAPGITVERRNEFMGLRGLENGLTRFHEVVVPATSLIGKEGQGLKIALTTLNTGRLSLPASCAAAGKLALKISREWSKERV